MFTGLVQAMGTVAAVERRATGGVRFLVDPRGWTHRPASGESISVSGCCLTLAEPLAATGGRLAFDVVPETLIKTTLGTLKEGSGVNLERSLMASDLMGGHVVQGHVDGVGVMERLEVGEDHRITVRPPPDLMPYIVPKGSICIDGVSLTVARVDPETGTFGVALIPTTLALTTLGRTNSGDRCNLEADIMAKTIVHYLRHFGSAPPNAR
jgi:riboflavin synthase